MITTDNILSHEFIGADTQISKSTNTKLVGLNGRIIDETKSMFKISTQTGTKLIPKNINYWKFSIKDQEITINGNKITKRSADRLGAKL